MEADATGRDCAGVRRFKPFRCFRRGLKAACRWTIRLGRGRSGAAAGRGCLGRRGAPPLASLSAVMLEPGEIVDFGDEPCMPSTSGQHQIQPSRMSMLSPLHTDEGGGSVFPLVLRRPLNSDLEPHSHQHRARQYHRHVDDNDLLLGSHHHRYCPHGVDAPWTHKHQQHKHNANLPHTSRACSCGGMATVRTDCGGGDCPVASLPTQDVYRHSDSSSSGSGSGCRGTGLPRADFDRPQQQPEGSLQHLIAVGSRQWGSGGWWDGRGLLRVKIYDFAIYADPSKAAHALRSAAADAASSSTSLQSSSSPADSGLRQRLHLDCGAASSPCRGASLASLRRSAAEVLVPPGSGVDMSLTIRACRNLPLSMLSQEFERVLQRRHEKAGGQPDDPALHELLSYFSRERLPEHVVVLSSAPLVDASSPQPLSAAASPGGQGGDLDRGAAVRKGAAITFSRSSCGSLVTEAGGRVLGCVHSPALTEALFDLYLGDQPVSKRAKAAAGSALQEMATGYGGGSSGVGGSSGWGRALGSLEAAWVDGGGYRYRPQPGERLVCPPGASSSADVDACVLQLP